MGSKHTKGPWSVVEQWMTGATIRANADKPLYTLVATAHGAIFAGPPYDEMLANARLIAAAPELLEALERVEQRARESGECPFCHQPPEVGCAPACPLTAARTAIKKARGEG